ncbi:DNA-helicase-2 [Diatraea saccharalis granulovirus]|uniref:DNA-helicase-2 n=1 Tax=Diatraea saccharalis granulovirus TaxID=1675862 RepID=A0A0R7EYS1_9BBAC|nr:DNA-helicase-2 [Diatraea saccharalis granulovirus]AKN80741.1 DNA-helicase-2 [Diatraea saccharalis granulovirus]
MSIDDIMKSYKSSDTIESTSLHYWYFENDDAHVVRRECRDVSFLVKMFEQTNDTPHTWSMIGNYYNTKVKPFLPRADYARLNPHLFNFCNLRGETTSKSVCVGEYIIWPDVSVNFLGWMIYLYINENYRLSTRIPLFNHIKLGPINLITDNKSGICLDISCKMYNEDGEIVFANTSTEPSTQVFTVKINEGELKVVFGKDYVISKSRVWLDYLINDDRVERCDFYQEFDFICESIDFDKLRWLGEERCPRPPQPIIEEEVMRDMITPCSNFEQKFVFMIDTCLKLINDSMIEKCPPAMVCSDDILNFYLKISHYSTFYILLSSLWQFCEASITMYNQYTLEDILFFVKYVCFRVEGGEEVFIDNLVYFSSKSIAQNFMNSLCFFVNPTNGSNVFFDSVSSYFVIHLAIYHKTESWTVTNSTVLKTEVDVKIKSDGFFKKLKVGKNDYIFNGHIYENYKNKKEHSIASLYDGCPEVAVEELVFNRIFNFYMTQEGMFDVCKKIYREPCPFIVMSTLRKNYITKSQVYIEKDTFKRLWSSINVDLNLFKVYHARKFLTDFKVITDNLKDCVVLNNQVLREEFEGKWKDTISWLLEYKATDIIIMMIKLDLDQPIKNIISLPVDVDLMGLQVAFVAHLLWPGSKAEIFFWSLLCNTYQDYEDWLEGFEFDDFINLDLFNSKKHIIEGIHRFLHDIDYDEENVLDRVKEIIDNTRNISNNEKKRRYESKRIIKCVGDEYNKFKRLVEEYDVWTDALIEYRQNENMYEWLTRFYIRIFLKGTKHDNLLQSVVEGYSYFRVFTNFHCNNSKALINFCASLAIPVDEEKLGIVLSSKPNCGKSSLWELLSKTILVYKQDKEEYKHNKNERDEKVKLYESQLYVMNEAQKFSKAYLKTNIDKGRSDSVRCNYSVMEKYNISFKVLVCNNEDDKIFVKDGYDKACSTRIGQMYFDHFFDPDVKEFSGSVYEHHVKKRYYEMRDINTKLVSSVKEFLSNVLKYNCNPVDGQIYYRHILENDNTYKHNKKCLYIYNTTLEALLYVLNVSKCRGATEVSEESVFDLIKNAQPYVTQMLHYCMRKNVTVEGLNAEFKRKFNNPKFYNADTKTYKNLNIASNEKQFRQFAPRFKANVDEDV